MKREKSCGAVVYYPAETGRLYLIEQMRGGHYAPCKGHMEAGETEQQTALREIQEETGLTVELDCGFRREMSYSPYPDCIKKVVYFVARADSLDTVAQPQEVRAIHWQPLEQAVRLLSFESDRELLRSAHRYLEQKKG